MTRPLGNIGGGRALRACFSILIALCCSSVALPVAAKNTILVNVIAPVSSNLFIANADGSGERALLRDSGLDYDASFSSDGGWVVFTSERGGAANIYRVRLDGSGLERLTSHSGFDDQAALSPDGKRMAFVSTRDGGVANIWILDLGTREARNLTGDLPAEPGKLHGYFRPAWSPDGAWLAFSSERDTQLEGHTAPSPGWEHMQRASVYIVRADGTGLRRISNGSECAGSPKWSPDGSRVVFYALPAEQTFAIRIAGLGVGGVKPEDIDSKIVEVRIDTGERVERASGPGIRLSPQFVGPDRIGYLLKEGESATLAYLEGTLHKQNAPGLAPGDMRNPAWTADGTHVVYQKFHYGFAQGQKLYSPDPSFDARFTGEFPAVSAGRRVALTPFPHGETKSKNVAVYLADVDGSNLKKIYEPEGMAMAPTWSPDGRQLIVTKGSFELGRPAQLILLNADGALVRELTEPKLSSSFPSWSPDGKHVVYRVKGSEHGLRIMDIKDGSIRTLTAGEDNFPFWSPDGARVCFTRNTGVTGAFDIFTIRPDGSDLHQLTKAPGNDSHCAWSTDSQSIIFSSSRLGFRDEAALYDTGAAQPYAELFTMHVSGSDQHPITEDKWEQGTPALVPWRAQGRDEK